MSERFQTIAAKGITLTLDLAAGHLRALEIEHGARRLRPLHTAPWVDDPAITGDPGVQPVLKCLSGDFFCAPFARERRGGRPLAWLAGELVLVGSMSVTTEGGRTIARFGLDRPVMGARAHQGDDAPRRPSLRLCAPHFRGRQRRRAGGKPCHDPFRQAGAPLLLAEGLRRIAADAAGGRSGPRPLALRLRRAHHRSFEAAACRRRRGRPPSLSGRRAPRGFRHAGRGRRARRSAGRRRSGPTPATSC